MHIAKMYKIKENGIVKITGKLTDSAEILETYDILTAKDDMELIRISDNEVVGNSIWLKDNDVQENYKEESLKETEVKNDDK